MGNVVSFIHLSDIHFNKYSGDIYDIDSDLRNEIEIDISKNAKSILENVKGILVCGDIAFSGIDQEYKIAQDFLSNICEILGIPENSIFCVPGNHDVDQTIAKKDGFLDLLQKEIERGTDSVVINNKLSKYLRDPSSKDIIFRHIDTYNTKFAGQYQCNINAEKPFWHQDIPLDDNGSILRLVGMNSTIISSADDHLNKSEERLMVIGDYQIPKRQDGITYLVLCHHPPACWKDPNNSLKNKINRRVSIQLYGHKHIQDISQEENTLIIGSGATHPSRSSDDWIPRYNWISLHLDSSNPDRLLKIKIYPRVLDKDSDQFVHDSHTCGSLDYVEYSLKLNNAGTETGSVQNEETVKDEFPAVTVQTNDSINLAGKSIDTKTLIYQFMNLSFLTRATILSKLDLLDEEDEGVNHVDILQKILQKAKMQQCIKDFWMEIDHYSK